MSLDKAMRQKSKQMELPRMRQGEARVHPRSGEAASATTGEVSLGNHSPLLMEQVVDVHNIEKALKRVKRNKGEPGVDGMTVSKLGERLPTLWPAIREQLLDGEYWPSPVRQASIQKSNGGVRKLGIPTVLDRLIQQAILQVIQPEIDGTFSDSSFGYRPGRSAHGALLAAAAHIQGGRSWVTDVDLSSFFDTVNHDILMSKMSKRVKDRRVLGLIGRYLRAGIMAQGVVTQPQLGTPQGGPLSPLLANVLLDEVDRELEKRGLSFCRYADDCNVFTRSERAARDVMSTLQKLYARLHLRINEAKSAVAPASERKFLGYRFHLRINRPVSLYAAPESVDKFKARVREITARNTGRSLEVVVGKLATFIKGWRAYFQLDGEKNLYRTLDKWIRQRLRVLELRQWRRGRTVYERLRARGVAPESCRILSSRRARLWHTAETVKSTQWAMPDDFYTRLGVPVMCP